MHKQRCCKIIGRAGPGRLLHCLLCRSACTFSSPAFLSDLYCSRMLSPLSTAFTRYLQVPGRLLPLSKTSNPSQKKKKCWTSEPAAIAYQPFRHCDVTTASFPTNLSGVLLFPCTHSKRGRESTSQKIVLHYHHFLIVTVAKECISMYHDHDSLTRHKRVLRPLERSRAFSI